MKTILVAGGAGYIGSHMVALLVKRGYEVVVADNLRTGHWQAVKGARKMYVGDLRDGAFLHQIFTENKIDGVINFAAFSLVGESVTNPLKYYGNNVEGAVSLLSAMQAHGVDKIVFSSTAAAYGEPEKQPIEEGDRTEPTNPYGATKLAIENMLKWCDCAYNLIPLVMKTALGQRDHIGIFGEDYPTPDGTCVRDYIHVKDLAEAHLLALEYLERGGSSDVFNLGNGAGYSVREIIETARRITGKEIKAVVEPRRGGDPSVLIASNKKAAEVLGWKPVLGLDQIISDAWAWHSGHPNGYEG